MRVEEQIRFYIRKIIVCFTLGCLDLEILGLGFLMFVKVQIFGLYFDLLNQKFLNELEK